jgi:hypothetical protein
VTPKHKLAFFEPHKVDAPGRCYGIERQFRLNLSPQSLPPTPETTRLNLLAVVVWVDGLVVMTA